MTKMRFVVPEAPAPGAGGVAAQRKLGKAIRLGLLDNNKGNADHLLGMVLERVRASLPIASVVSLKKATAVLAAPPETLDKLASEADCVITAMAD